MSNSFAHLGALFNIRLMARLFEAPLLSIFFIDAMRHCGTAASVMVANKFVSDEKRREREK